MQEWQTFYKIRVIMKKVTHPLMVEKYNTVWNDLKELKVKPSQLNQAFHLQDFLRKILPELKKQAEACLYYSYKRTKGNDKNDIIYNNSTYMLQIISLLEQY